MKKMYMKCPQESAFDLGRDNFTSATIEATGYIHHKSFWVDVGAR